MTGGLASDVSLYLAATQHSCVNIRCRILLRTAQVSFVTTLGTDYCGLWPRCLRYEEFCVDMRETLRALTLPSAGRAFPLLLSDESLRAQQDDTMFF